MSVVNRLAERSSSVREAGLTRSCPDTDGRERKKGKQACEQLQAPGIDRHREHGSCGQRDPGSSAEREVDGGQE